MYVLVFYLTYYYKLTIDNVYGINNILYLKKFHMLDFRISFNTILQ